jgi:hypothetical protein
LVNILNCLKIIKKISKGVYKSNQIEKSFIFLNKLPLFDKLEENIKKDCNIISQTYCFLSILKTFNSISQENLFSTLSENLDLDTKSKNR